MFARKHAERRVTGRLARISAIGKPWPPCNTLGALGRTCKLAVTHRNATWLPSRHARWRTKVVVLGFQRKFDYLREKSGLSKVPSLNEINGSARCPPPTTF